MTATPRLIVEVQDLKRYLQLRVTLTAGAGGAPSVDLLKVTGMHTGRLEKAFDVDADWNAGIHTNTTASGGALTLAVGQATGSWISTAIDRGEQVDGLPLGEWTATIPSGASLVVESRSSIFGVDWTPWAPQQSPGSRKPLASHTDISVYVAAASAFRAARKAGQCTVTINDPDSALKGLLHRWDDLVVWQGWQPAGEADNKAKLRKFRGVIMKSPRLADTPTTTYSIEAAGYTVVLGRYTAPRVWDTKRADEILVDAIANFGPRYIGTARVQANSEPMAIYRSKYEKLLRILEDMAKLTNWVGWVDDDLEFRWENPSAKVGQVALTVAARNIVAGSASFERVGPFLNDLLVFGGLVRTDIFTDDRFPGNALQAAYPLLYYPRNITVKVKNVADPDTAYVDLVVGVDGLQTFADGKDALFNYKQKLLKFPQTMDGKVIWARYQYDYAVNARYRDTKSIMRYGPLQDVMVDTKIRDKRAALEFAKAKVREGSRGRWEGSLRPMGPAIMEGRTSWPFEPGQLIPVAIPSIDLAQNLELVDEAMESSGNMTLRVSFTLREP